MIEKKEFTRMLLLALPLYKGEPLFEDLYSNGAKGGTICLGRRPPENCIAYMLCFGDEPIELLQILTTDDDYEVVFNSIVQNKLIKKIKNAKLYVIPTITRYKEGVVERIGQMISVIVTRGYADDVMATARKAGADGGSIIHARGTGRKEDEKFFGITIVPEKEQLLIAVSKEKADKVKTAIKELEILHKPGMGIMFTLPIEEYVNLGKYEKYKNEK
ncbi:MAG: P-II family nitrogen regulator [Treponema sp.]